MFSTSKKGYEVPVFVGVMVAIVLFVFVVTSVWSIKDITTDARDQMDCSNSSITSGQKGACIQITWFPFILIGCGIIGGLFYIFNRKFGQV